MLTLKQYSIRSAPAYRNYKDLLEALDKSCSLHGFNIFLILVPNTFLLFIFCKNKRARKMISKLFVMPYNFVLEICESYQI